jgi:hypothetical protein
MMRRWVSVFALVMGAIVGGCGGGGGGGGDGGGSSGGGGGSGITATISGHVWIGAVSGATVQLDQVDAQGRTTRLEQTTSAADGGYAFHARPAAGTVFMVTASGGSWRTPAGAIATLDTPMRAVAVATGAAQRVTVNPFAEVAVRVLAQSSAADWSTAAVEQANGDVAAWLNMPSLVDFRPLDLQVQQTAAPADNDFLGTLYASAVATFAQRLGLAPAAAPTFEALHHVVAVDPEDDRLFPAFIGGLVDRVDQTALPADLKRYIKGAVLLGTDTPPVDAELAKLIPNGISSGSTSAAMPDDVFQLLDRPGAHTHFNGRGALVGFTDADWQDAWRMTYTASVAEVYGDGEVGIGRWNGGAEVVVNTPASGLGMRVSRVMNDGLDYAVAKPAASIPACGLRRLGLEAHTMPSLLTMSDGAQRAFTGVTADSTLGLQYLDKIYAGADIGVQAADGNVVRYRTIGGSAAPWATGFPIGQELYLAPVEPAGALSQQTMRMTLLVSGEAANKVVARFTLPWSANPTGFTAVFASAPGVPDATGCVTPGPTPNAIVPRPADGEQYVFMSLDTDTTFLGAPRPATFGDFGELATVLSPFTLSGVPLDLAGNALASIGRRTASVPIGVSRSVPYAVVMPGNVTMPTQGEAVYDLVAATAPLAARGTAGSSVPPGQLTRATLTITYGAQPMAHLVVEGVVDGVRFALAPAVNGVSTPVDVWMYGPVLNGNQVTGALSAGTGEWVALTYGAAAGVVPVNGALLMRKR